MKAITIFEQTKGFNMSVFDVLTLIGGLCLFLYGMNVMGNALERSAGGKLEVLLGKHAKRPTNNLQIKV